MRLPQIITTAKRQKWFDWITEPNGTLHPNTERALLNGCTFDVEAAEKVRMFFEDLMRIPNPAGSGTMPFAMLRWWYRRVLAQLFGWKQKDGRRRYDKAFITTAKKSAKSTTMAGLPIYMITAEGIHEAEAYATATDRDQASLIYGKTSKIVRDSKHLSRVLKRKDSLKRIEHPASGSWFEAISSDADSAEGKNPHLLICDELHAWRDRSFFNSLMYGDIMREQPLFLMITTAGDDVESVGYEEYEFAKELLDPASDLYSQSHFAHICEAFPEQTVDSLDWDDPAGWVQANPSILEGVGSVEKLKTKCEEAKASPGKKNSFIRYICNRWVAESDELLISQDDWNRCQHGQKSYNGASAYGGLDLASSEDFSALCVAWDDRGQLQLEWRFWIAEDGIKDKQDRWRVPLIDWIRDGWVTVTSGNTTDYSVIRRDISGALFDDDGSKRGDKFDGAICEQFAIEAIGYDPYNAKELCEFQLFNQDGIPMEEFRQSILHMNEPTKTFARRVKEGRINHGGNPVAKWMIGNVVVKPDASGNIRPLRPTLRRKIDGIVAAIMAVGLATKSMPTVSGSMFVT